VLVYAVNVFIDGFGELDETETEIFLETETFRKNVSRRLKRMCFKATTRLARSHILILSSTWI